MLGTLLLLTSIAASGMMVLKHFLRIDIPGCGAGSPCDQAAASRWGTVPLVNLPTSFLALGYFTALLIAWTGSQGALSTPARWLARTGGLVSLGFLVVIAIEKLACPYCLVAHACNLILLAIIETAARRTRTTAPSPFITAAIVGVASLAALGIADQKAKKDAQAKAEQALAESTRQMSQPKPASAVQPPTQPANASTQPSAQQPTTPVAAPTDQQRGFSGRYRWGPEKAPVRIVMYTDYQCRDCKNLESQLTPFLSNPNIAVLIKPFPWCRDCNPKAPHLHDNACIAARAAEAAGMIYGTDGFWKMHHWLFSVNGYFVDNKVLVPGLQSLGFDPQAIIRTMQSPETLDRVKADVAEAWGLGITQTPLIFINGVELKGWSSPDALTRTVNAVLAMNLEPDTFASDLMPTALETYMSDWSESPIRQLPPEVTQRSIGPADAPVTVVLFGDYMEPGTQEADGLLRLFATGPNSKIRYSFAQYPVNDTCNPTLTDLKKFDSCRAALAAEAAAMMAGDEGFWKMHDWLMLNKGVVTDESLAAAAGLIGVDGPALTAGMQNPTPAEAIRIHSRAGKSLGITGIPMIFINGRQVPRFKLDNENLLPRMIDAAAGQ
jgi:protein-disulfide isomerase